MLVTGGGCGDGDSRRGEDGGRDAVVAEANEADTTNAPESPATKPDQFALPAFDETPIAEPREDTASAVESETPAAQKKNDDELQQHGLRQIAGKHLTLITDVASRPAVEALPAVFDRAIEHWCRYFGIDAKQVADWHVVAHLMKDDRPFRELNLLPKSIPPFNNGYAMARRVWLFEQKSDYYRRHLLLHEGTHAFMFEVFGTCGPSWYMEGIAELLATHRWQNDVLTMGYYPKDRQEVPLLGRIRMVKDEVAAGRPQSFRSIMAYDGRAFFTNKTPYGWSWAVCAFLDGHPRYEERFRQLPRVLADTSSDKGEAEFDLSTKFRQTMDDDWPELNDEWQVFMRSITHGHDLRRTAIDFKKGKPLPAAGHDVEIAADRGWQSAAVRLEAGKTYLFAAKGRYQIAKEAETWWCEPGGVTIRYHNGQPLGKLMASIRPDAKTPEEGTAATPHPGFQPYGIGLNSAWRPAQSGTLYLRINESPADLGDNAGTLSVEIRELVE